MPVFQIGVILSKKITTDVIVRVEAATEKEARQLALKEVGRRTDDPKCREDSDFGLQLGVDWDETHEYGWEGVSEYDYSNMGLAAYPDADIDLTRKES